MTLHRATNIKAVFDLIAVKQTSSINLNNLSDLIRGVDNHWLMDDNYVNLFGFTWTGPGVYHLQHALTNDAQMKPAIAEATAYIRKQGCKVLWAAHRVEDMGSMIGLKAFGMTNTGKSAYILNGLKPIWRRGFS